MLDGVSVILLMFDMSSKEDRTNTVTTDSGTELILRDGVGMYT